MIYLYLFGTCFHFIYVFMIIGKNKHEKLGTVYNPAHYPMATPSEETVERCKAIFSMYNINVIIGG